MIMTNIRTYANLMGINPGKLSKADLIKKIQVEEGNFNCYATASNSVCDQVNCLWRGDCFTTAGEVGAS
ncbi:MAG: SAP domain-containing protein [Gallionella sp.]|nr:SAP domain-containing protein [Gallionella sp.]